MITAMSAGIARAPFKSYCGEEAVDHYRHVVASRMLMSHGYLKAVFDIFDKYRCPIDMVSTSEVSHLADGGFERASCRRSVRSWASWRM